MPEDRAAEGSGGRELRLPRSDPVAQALVAAIHAGELGSLAGLLREQPGLAAARLVDDKGGSGTPLHAAAGWPGFFPYGPEVVPPAPRSRAAPRLMTRSGTGAGRWPGCWWSAGHGLTGCGTRRRLA